MKKTYKTLTVITALLFSLSMHNLAFAKSDFNVAIVDVKQVIQNSPQLQAFRVEQNNKMNDLNIFVAKAKADVAKQTDPEKSKALEQKYNDELASKKAELDKEAAKKLSDIYSVINNAVSVEAKKAGYDLIIAKDSTLYGGVDITNDIIKALK